MKHQPLQVEQLAFSDDKLGDVHQVIVQISSESWAQQVKEICRAVFRASVAKGRPFTWMTIAGSPSSTEDQRTRALQRVRQILGQEGTSWALTPEEATSLAQELLEAAEEPRACACGRLVQQPSSLTTQCATCEDRP